VFVVLHSIKKTPFYADYIATAIEIRVEMAFFLHCALCPKIKNCDILMRGAHFAHFVCLYFVLVLYHSFRYNPKNCDIEMKNAKAAPFEQPNVQNRT